jgi:voltage-gated potassium channel
MIEKSANSFFRFSFSILRGLRDREFRGLLLFVLVILITGTVFYHHFEHWRWIDSFYFSSISLTTVGYGDITPKTDIGKIFTIIYIFSGVGVILGFLNVVAKHASEQQADIKETLDKYRPSLKKRRIKK